MRKYNFRTPLELIMHRGYIKLWRKAKDSKMYRNPRLWALWTFLLMEAAHKPCKIFIGNKEVKIGTGEIVITLKHLVEEMEIPRGTLQRRLSLLEEIGMITRKAVRKFTRIKITNWEAYQMEETKGGTIAVHERYDSGTIPVRLPINNKHYKNVKKQAAGRQDFSHNVAGLAGNLAKTLEISKNETEKGDEMPVGNLIHAVIPEKRHIVKDLLDAMISNFPEERILRNIQLANQKSKQNYAGFLGRAVREDWAATNPPEEKSGKIDQELKAARKAEFMSDMQAMFDLENQLLEMPAAALEKLRDRFRATIGHQPAVLNIFSIEGVRYPDFLFFCHNQLGNKENEE